MDRDRPLDLLRNLRHLIELDAFFEVDSLPRPAAEAVQEAATASAAPAADPGPATPSSDAPHPVGALDLPAEPGGALDVLAEGIGACAHCGLCAQRTRAVPGEGAPQPEILFVGEGPGADEDRQGRPFVGAAGQLLDKMIAVMGFARDEVFIANVVKCRPPGNRNPEPEEVAACLPWLERQVDALRPKIICTLGNIPLRALSGEERPGITRRRGRPFTWRGYPVIPTFHPSYLLRNAAGKKPAWEDLKQVLAAIGRDPPGR